MASSPQKLEEDLSPVYLPEWELPPNFTEQRPQVRGGFSIGKRIKSLKAAMSHPTDTTRASHHTAPSRPATLLNQAVQDSPVEPSAVRPSRPPQPPKSQYSPNAPAQLKPHKKVAEEGGEGRSLNRKSRICGIERKRFLRYTLYLFCLIIAITALGVGLGIGLRPKRFLPLPTNTGTFKGDLTYYQPGLGACGVVSTDDQAIVSVSHFLFDSLSTDSNPNHNTLCGRKLRAETFDLVSNTWRSVDLTVLDRCVGCAPTDLDVSPGAFEHLADPARGRVDVTWAWLSPAP